MTIRRALTNLAKGGLLACLLLALAPAAFAAGDDGQLDAVHHTADGYYLDFSPLGKIELPRIFVIRDADGNLGVDFFGSTAAVLRSGRYVLDNHGDYGAPTAEAAVDSAMVNGEHISVDENELLDEGQIFDLIESGAHLDASLVPGAGSVVIDLSITRHLVFALLAAFIVILLFSRMAGKYKRGVGRTSAPQGKTQNLLEVLIVYMRDNVVKPAIGDKWARFMPYLMTVFFFILIANLAGLVPYGATATANLSVTVVLALFTFFVTQINGSADHWKHVFWPPGIPTPLKPLMVIVEVLGLFTKPFALAMRLFANMTAGHLVILNLLGLIFIFGAKFGAAGGYGVTVVAIPMTLFIYFLEILVAFIQAYVFTMLSAIFIGMAVHEHHHDDHHHDVMDAAIPGIEQHVPGRFTSGATAGTLAGNGKPQAKVEPVAV